jgi:hypothetical protein
VPWSVTGTGGPARGSGSPATAAGVIAGASGPRRRALAFMARAGGHGAAGEKPGAFHPSCSSLASCVSPAYRCCATVGPVPPANHAAELGRVVTLPPSCSTRKSAHAALHASGVPAEQYLFG